MLVVDKNNRIVMVLAGQPADHRRGDGRMQRPWRRSQRAVYRALERCARSMEWRNRQCLPKPPGKGNTSNRRGDFPTFNVGLSMGCGAQVCSFP